MSTAQRMTGGKKGKIDFKLIHTQINSNEGDF